MHQPGMLIQMVGKVEALLQAGQAAVVALQVGQVVDRVDQQKLSKLLKKVRNFN